MIFTRYKKILSSFMLFVSVVVFFLAPIAVQDRGIAEVRYASAQGYGVESTGCAVFSVAGPAKNSMIECVAYLTYWVVFVPMSFIAYLGGTFLDFFMSFSLSDTSYRHPFVEQGWKMVRDISNIFFILVLLFVALAGMFNSAPDFKKTLPRIIIAALLINFSLFFTRVLIDVSNITARVFYNSIEVVTTDSTEGANVFGTKSVSTAIISNINPQRVIGTADNVKAGGVVGNGSTIQSNDRAGYFSLVALIAAVVCGVIAYVFFSVGTVFLGRVVGLYFAMIFAPFALMSTTLPALGNLEFVGWGKWWSNLISLVILGPIFTFMLYLVAMFTSLTTDLIHVAGVDGATAAYAANGSGQSTFVSTVVSVILPMALISMLLLASKKMATKYSGEIAGKVASLTNKALMTTGMLAGGVALGAAAGGTAVLGRATAGRAGSTLASGKRAETLRNTMSDPSKGKFARWRASKELKGYEKLSQSSFDVRKTKAVDYVEKKTKLNLDNKALSRIGLSEKKTSGGYQGLVKRYQDEKTEDYKKRIDRASKVNFEKDVDVESFYQSKYDKELEKFSQTYKKQNPNSTKQEIEAKFKEQGKAPVVYKTKEEVQTARREGYIQNLKGPTYGEQALSTSNMAQAAALSGAGMTFAPVAGTAAAALSLLNANIEARKTGRLKAIEGLEKTYKKGDKNKRKMDKVNSMFDSLTSDFLEEDKTYNTEDRKKFIDKLKEKLGEDATKEKLQEALKKDPEYDNLIKKQSLYRAAELQDKIDILKKSSNTSEDTGVIAAQIQEVKAKLEVERSRGSSMDVNTSAQLGKQLRDLENQRTQLSQAGGTMSPIERKFQQQQHEAEIKELQNLMKNRDSIAKEMESQMNKDKQKDGGKKDKKEDESK